MPKKEGKMKKATFTGRGGDLFGIFLVNFLLTVITLGIYAPWARARYLRYMVGHIEFDGEPFEFHGKGGELFWGILKVLVVLFVLLLPYTVTIAAGEVELALVFYGVFFLALLILIPVFLHGALRYTFSRLSWRGIRMTYTGQRGELLLLYLKGLFLTLITLGIYGPWFSCELLRYVYGHIRIGNVSFGFEGKGAELFIHYLLGFLFSLLTLGLYIPWFYVRVARFFVSHTYVEQEGKRSFFAFGLKGDEVLGFWIIRILLAIVTLGIATPWIIADWMKRRLDALSLEGDIDSQSLIQHPVEDVGAMGFGFFDLGDGLWGSVFPL